MAIIFYPNDRIILIEAPATTVSVQELLNAIRDYESLLPEGMILPRIANASGKENLGGGVYVGITLELLDNWRVQFEDRSGPEYVLCRIYGGNLVTTNIYNNEPIKPSDYVFAIISQASSSTLVLTGGSIPTAEENANAVWESYIAEHQSSGTFGHYVQKKLLSVAKFLGLK